MGQTAPDPRRDIPLGTNNLAQRLPRLFAGFDARFAEGLTETCFRIAGVGFQCRSAASHYGTILARMLPITTAVGAAPVRILVDLKDCYDWPRWSDPYFQEREAEAALSATPYRLHFHDQTDFWQFYHRPAGRGLQLMQDARAYPAWDPGSPLRNLIHWALVEGGSGLVHAGTLGWGGKGVLLAGAGGSGKSGTVLAGLLHGLNSVGDDYVAITAGGGLVAHRAFCSLKQDPAGFGRLGLGGRLGTDMAVNWQGKYLFTFDDLALPAQPDSLPLVALCLPKVTGGARTTFERVTSREAFLALAPSGVSQIPSARPETFRLSALLSRELPAFRAALGTEPAEIADAFAAFLQGFPA